MLTLELFAGSKVLLASASQDKYIRIWAIQPDSPVAQSTQADSFSSDIARYTSTPESQQKQDF